MKVLVCIPARYGSTRFAGKVLAKDTGKFLIQHTYEQVLKAKLVEKVLIATDDKRVLQGCKSFGADCVMTSAGHQSGTDRIAEAVKNIKSDIIINVQADEPEIPPEHIDLVAGLLCETQNSKLKTQNCQMATLVADFKSAEQIANPNIVKVITDCKNRAIYFSRAVIPYDRENCGTGKIQQYLRHIGIYAYRRDFLLKITTLPQSPLEKIEKLEQLRAIENGFDILTAKVTHTCDGIDTPEQYTEFVKRYMK